MSSESETTCSVTELLQTRDRGVSERSQDGRMLAIANFVVPCGVVISRYFL